ncbi:MAG TPA: DNA polymerase III subunit beta [Phycisphaerales bacterium]|nr:DNA polymerase III subunit beta [Phycisphaerales bacterium]
MKVICDRGALLSAVNLVGGVVAARTPKIELTCIRLTAKKVGTKGGGAGLLTLAATDAEIAVRMSIARVDVAEEGEALVPADKLRQIVSAEEQEPTLTIESDGEVCHIRGQDAKFKVFGYQVANFPPIPEFPHKDPKAASFAINADTLRQLVDRTAFSTARETSRYAINGVLFNRQGRKIEMVATDGRRLALARGTIEGAGGAGDENRSCIIPTKALTLLSRIISDPESTVRVAITDNQAIFAIDEDDAPGAGTMLASNLVEGSFPPYEEVIPKDQDKKATFDVDKLSSAVKRAALLTNEESRGVKMAFNTGKESKLRLSSRAPEMGEAEIDVGMESYEGSDIEIGFNPAFLTDALRVIAEPKITFEMKAPNKPGLMRSGNDFLYVVMPVSLQ